MAHLPLSLGNFSSSRAELEKSEQVNMCNMARSNYFPKDQTGSAEERSSNSAKQLSLGKNSLPLSLLLIQPKWPTTTFFSIA